MSTRPPAAGPGQSLADALRRRWRACVEVPEFVNQLKKAFASEKSKTVIPGDDVIVDFRSGVISYRGDQFRFPPLGTVPQSLVIAGGVENLVARKLGGADRDVASNVST